MDTLEKAGKYLKFGRVVEGEKLLRAELEAVTGRDPAREQAVLEMMIGQLHVPCRDYFDARDCLCRLESLQPDPETLARNRALVEAIKMPEVDSEPDYDAPAFVELLALLDSDDFLVARGEAEGFFLVEDIATAAWISKRQGTDEFDEWPGLRSEASSEVLRQYQRKRLKLHRFDAMWDREISPKLERIGFSEPYRQADLVDDLLGDMNMLLTYRLVGAEASTLFEEMIRAYRLGYWPCGWQGEYPEGRMAVFAFRKSDAAGPA